MIEGKRMPSAGYNAGVHAHRMYCAGSSFDRVQGQLIHLARERSEAAA